MDSVLEFEDKEEGAPQNSKTSDKIPLTFG